MEDLWNSTSLNNYRRAHAFNWSLSRDHSWRKHCLYSVRVGTSIIILPSTSSVLTCTQHKGRGAREADWSTYPPTLIRQTATNGRRNRPLRLTERDPSSGSSMFAAKQDYPATSMTIQDRTEHYYSRRDGCLSLEQVLFILSVTCHDGEA